MMGWALLAAENSKTKHQQNTQVHKQKYEKA